ncbi:MAG: sensor histidine kinase [Phycisphaerales bacterium]
MTALPTSAAEIKLPKGADVSAQDLADLVSAFTEVGSRLEQTHRTLRDQVARLECELRAANEQIRRSQALAALGEMAAGIAHEVRNPLGSIGLYASMLIQDLPDKPDCQAVARKIATGVRTLDAIVGDVLTFAREAPVRDEPTPSDALIDGAVEACRYCFERSGVEVVRTDRSREPEMLRCDPGLARQALVNIIRNAAEAVDERPTGRDARVVIDLRRDRVRQPGGKTRDMCAVSVRDSGRGIDADAAKRMFNPFFTTRRTGTGLGLAIVHRIMDAHGGRVSVRNAPDGEGAVAELVFPIEPQSQAQEPLA